MFEENQSEITKALLGLIFCSVFSLAGADLSTRFLEIAPIIGIIIGMLTGALFVEFFMNKFIHD